MARYHGPRRTKKSPSSVAEQKFGNIVLWIMGIIGIGYLLLMVGGTLYEIATNNAVVEWGNDVATAVSEHDWQYTDALLYGGIVFILVGRYTKLIDKLFE
jgi:hypothetical protein